jgi:ASC-1-like (ASCH) protein
MRYELQIRSAFFKSVISGKKTFEIMDNTNHGFQAGDTILLKETKDMLVSVIFTGREQRVEVTYVTGHNQPQNQVVFAFTLLGDVIDNRGKL